MPALYLSDPRPDHRGPARHPVVPTITQEREEMNTTIHYKQKRHEEAVARVRAQTILVETWREAVARRDRLAAEYIEACELVADCAVDIQAATEASAGAIAEVLGVSKGTVLHQLRAGRALRSGDPVPRRYRGGRSEREKRAARRRHLREEVAGADAEAIRQRDEVRAVNAHHLLELPIPDGVQEAFDTYRERWPDGLAPWETPVGPPIGPAPTFLELLAGTLEVEEVRSDG